MSPIPLSELEKDAFAEILNIGVGHAAASLSQMIGQEIKLSIPVVEIMDRDLAVLTLAGEENSSLTGVKEQFAGSFKGDAFLFFPEESSLELVRLLLGQDLPLDVLTEMEQEALTEVGNIILTGCLSTIADVLKEEITNEVPEFSHGEAAALLRGEDTKKKGSTLLFLKTKILFRVRDKDIQGHVTFLMDLEEMDTFRRKVAHIFGMEMEA